MDLLIFPNQLFKKKYLPKSINNIIILEDPIFFGYRDKYYKFNKLKLVLHRSTMKYYEEYIKKYYTNVYYIEFHELLDYKYTILKTFMNISVFEPNDHLLHNRLNNQISIKRVLKSPNFLLSTKQLSVYYDKKRKRDTHYHFYNFVKKEFNILKDIPSYDHMNRKKFNENYEIPKLPQVNQPNINNAILYVNKHFPKNHGNINNFIYPITHKDSIKWLKHFIKCKLNNFGTYQDAINNKNPFMFHSVISPMLNCGLLNPIDVLTEINKQKKHIDINNYEGFIRQLIGWREYQRYIYTYHYSYIIKTNIFNHTKKLTKKWYNGSTGILPVDDCIKIAFNYGYLHHINRLMIMSNFMNLSEIHPDECYKWFMEFAVDSYDWVMIQNVYSMGQWSDGGLTMRKPYITSDNYILKMSNYNKNDKWTKIWNEKYKQFIKKNKKHLKHTILY